MLLDVTRMSTKDIAKALTTFYEFVALFGYHYLTEEGLQLLQNLMAEYTKRQAAKAG